MTAPAQRQWGAHKGTAVTETACVGARRRASPSVCRKARYVGEAGLGMANGKPLVSCRSHAGGGALAKQQLRTDLDGGPVLPSGLSGCPVPPHDRCDMD